MNEQNWARPETAALQTRSREIASGIAALVTPQLIEEHHLRPAGRHSPELAFVLGFLRRAPTAGKLALVATARGTWKIVVLSGVQGQPHEVLENEVFASEDEAAHEIFLRRLSLIGALPPDGQSSRVRPEDG